MSLAARIGDLATRIGQEIKALTSSVSAIDGRVTAIENEPDLTFKTVNGETITGTGNIAIPAGPPPPVVVQATAPTSPVAGTFYVVTG